MQKREQIKIWLTHQERQTLDHQAAALHTSRGQLIRERALGATAPPPVDLSTYQRAIDNAARTVSGIPRCQLEAIVATVITTVAAA
jgi:hypothetical protein